MKISGRQKFLKRLGEMPKAARREIRKELERSSGELEKTVRHLAPSRRGALRRSVGRTWGDYAPENANVRGVAAAGGKGDSELTVTVHAGDAVAWYAALVEFGTQPHAQPGNRFNAGEHPGASAKPFFFPAYRLHRAKIRRRLAAAHRKAAKAVLQGLK